LVGHRWLPRRQRDPLPPQQITDRALASAQSHDDLSPQQRAALAVIEHFRYGTATGALYGSLISASPVSMNYLWSRVWAGSYMGLLPSVGLYRSAKDEPVRRNLLMLGAHVVWGASLGFLTELLSLRNSGTVELMTVPPQSAIHGKTVPHMDTGN
jgi:hypothetical protein